MARIPVVTSQVTPFAGGIDVSASPEAFGAQIGQAKIGLGNSIGQLGSAIGSTAERFSAEAKQRQGEADQLTVANALANPISNFDQQYNDITLKSTGNSAPDVYNAYMKSIDDGIKTLGLTGDAATKYRLTKLRYAPTYTSNAVEYDRSQGIKIGGDKLIEGIQAQINSVRNGGGAEATGGIDPVTKRPIPSRYDVALENGIGQINAQPIDAAAKADGIRRFKSDLAGARFEALGEAALSSKTDAPAHADAALEDFRNNPRWKQEMTPEAYDQTLQKLISVKKQSTASIEQRIKIKLHEFGTMAQAGYADKIDPAEIANLRRMANDYGDEEDQANIATLEIKTGIADASKHDSNADLKAKKAGALSNPLGDVAPIQDLSKTSGFGGKTITPTNFIIHHSGEGNNVNDVIGTLKRRGFGVQFVIDKEGKIYQLTPDPATFQEHTKPRGGISNANSIGVEVVAGDDSQVNPAQIEASKRLFSFLHQRYGITADHVYGHGSYQGDKQPTEGKTISDAIRAGGGDVGAAAVATSGKAIAPGKYKGMYETAGAKYGVRPELLAAQGKQESGFNPNVTSSAGAQGIAQFIPSTAKEYGVNVRDPASSIDGQARFMRDLLKRYNGNESLALAAYNAGPGRVDQFVKNGRALPQETQKYVAAILGSKGALDEADSGTASMPVKSAGDVGGEPGKYVTWDQFVAAQTYQELIDGNDKAMKDDFMSYAASKGMDVSSVIDPTTGALPDDEAFKQRSEDYLTAVEHHNPLVTKDEPYANPLTDEEAGAMVSIVNSHDEFRQLDLMKHIAVMDQRTQDAMLHQIGEDSAEGRVFAYAGSVYSRDKQMAQQMMHGHNLLANKELDFIKSIGGSEKIDDLYQAAAGLRLTGMSAEAQGVIKDAAISLFAGRVRPGTKTPGGDEMEAALLDAIGMQKATINSVDTVIPKGMDETAVNKTVQSLDIEGWTKASINGQPPLDGDTGKPMSAEDMNVAGELVAIDTKGHYKVVMEDGRIVASSFPKNADDTGEAYVFTLTPELVKETTPEAAAAGETGAATPPTAAEVSAVPGTSPVPVDVTGYSPTGTVPAAAQEPPAPPAPPGTPALPPYATTPLPSETAAAVPPEITPAEGQPPTPYLPPYMTTPTGQPPTAPPFGDPTGKPYEPQSATRAGGPAVTFSPGGSATGAAAPAPAPEPKPVPAKPTSSDYPYEPKKWKKALVKGGMSSKEADKYIADTTKEWRASAGAKATFASSVRQSYHDALLAQGVEEGSDEMKTLLKLFDETHTMQDLTEPAKPPSFSGGR